nr:MAG TPA: hypothetical protein [Caudoviricetes sp.]
MLMLERWGYMKCLLTVPSLSMGLFFFALL